MKKTHSHSIININSIQLFKIICQALKTGNNKILIIIINKEIHKTLTHTINTPLTLRKFTQINLTNIIYKEIIDIIQTYNWQNKETKINIKTHTQ